MKMKQVELQADNGDKMITWLDSRFAREGVKIDLNLGDGKRSPIMQVMNVWDTERDIAEIQERQTNQRSFGGSIKD